MDRAQDAFERRLNPVSSAPLVAAFSGGSDSTALLVKALAWARAHGRRVLAVTVDHRLQDASAAWSRRAGETARSLGAASRIMAWTEDKPATGIPAAARRARHRLLAQAAREAGAGVILLGHTRDDLEEARWMRAAGSSVGSPAEWSPSPVWPEGRGLFHLRPLLECRREELRTELKAGGTEWVEDPANADHRFARSRARAALGGDIGGEGAEDPIDLAGLAAACGCDAWGGLNLERRVLAHAPAEAARRFIQAAVVCVGGGERPPRRDRTRVLVERLLGEGRVEATLAGARVSAEERISVFRDIGERKRGALGPMELASGATQVWDGRFEIMSPRAVKVVGPLAGLSPHLAPEEHRLVKSVPAAARASLPVVERPDGRLTCPVLAATPGLGCRSLVSERLLGACGVIAREA
jgi:tRNA(Ile)-lysidine synthase